MNTSTWTIGRKNPNFLVYLKHGVFSLCIDTIRKFRRHNCGKIFKNRIRIQNARELYTRKKERKRKEEKKETGGRQGEKKRRKEGKEKREKKKDKRERKDGGRRMGRERRMLPVHT